MELLPTFSNLKRATMDKMVTETTNKGSEFVMQPAPTTQPATQSQTPKQSTNSAISPESKPPTRSSSLFLKLLHTDIRYMIYDQLVDQEHEIVISPHHNIYDHSPITALASTCTTTHDEVQNWLTRRKDLTQNSTFAVFNPYLTTFKLCWFDANLIKLTNTQAKSEKYQRCYSPSAAALHINLLELWQRAMTLTKSIEKDNINCAELSHPRLRNLHPIHGTATTQLQRLLSWNQHDEDGVKDFLVFDPKKWSGETQVTWEYRTEYSWQPYVWSSDWENHERKQMYAFSHPEEGGKWVFGQEAEGTEATREGLGWWEAFGHMAQRAEEIQEKIREAIYGRNEDIE